MKLVCISDTHLKAQDQLTTYLKEFDNDCILIHAGDALNRGTIDEGLYFLNWFESLDFKHKIYVPGNHDFCFDEYGFSSKNTAKLYPDFIKQHYPSVTLLIDSTIEIDGVVFGGVCKIPDLPNWAFFSHEYTRATFFETFPKVDVLINHAPFEQYLLSEHYEYHGDKLCQKYCEAHNIKTFICGHIHENRGHKVINGVNCYNVASLCSSYCDVRPPVIIEI